MIKEKNLLYMTKILFYLIMLACFAYENLLFVLLNFDNIFCLWAMIIKETFLTH